MSGTQNRVLATYLIRGCLMVRMSHVANTASTRKLVELAARERVALMMYGHDAAQRRTLRQLPDYDA